MNRSIALIDYFPVDDCSAPYYIYPHQVTDTTSLFRAECRAILFGNRVMSLYLHWHNHMNVAIIVISYTCAFPAMTSQNVYCWNPIEGIADDKCTRTVKTKWLKMLGLWKVDGCQLDMLVLTDFGYISAHTMSFWSACFSSQREIQFCPANFKSDSSLTTSTLT